MVARYALIFAIFCGLISGWAQSEEQAVNRGLASLIKDLDSEEFEDRVNAYNKILKLGPGACGGLQQALQCAKGLELRESLMRLIQLCAPGGTPCDGFSLYVEADKSEIRFGETVRFTILLRNQTENARTLLSGSYGLCDSKVPGNLQSTSISELLTRTTYRPVSTIRQTKPVKRKVEADILERKSLRCFTLDVTVIKEMKQDAQTKNEETLQFHETFTNDNTSNPGWFVLMDRAGEYRFRVFRDAVSKETMERYLDDWEGPAPLREELVSNSVRIRIKDD